MPIFSLKTEEEWINDIEKTEDATFIFRTTEGNVFFEDVKYFFRK